LSLLEVSEAEIAMLKEQSALANTESLTRILEVLTDSELRLRDAASKKILLEVTLLKAIETRSAVSLDSVLRQLNQWRGQTGAGGQSPSPSAPANVSSRKTAASVPLPPKTEMSASNAPTDAGGAADLAGLWAKLVEAVGRASPFTRSYLVDAIPVSFEKNILTIGFDTEFEDHLGLVDNARNHTLLQTKLMELGHANTQIRFIKVEAPAGQTPQTAGAMTVPVAAAKSAVPPAPVEREKSAAIPFNKADFKKDPLIQKALEIFKGQIVEVRA
jgi:DNA polymerase III gamma/tau subunit